MKKTAAPFLLAALMLTTACEGVGTKEFMGTLSGAAAGGWAGAQVGGGTGKLVAIGVGTFLGAIGGNAIGASLDKADKAYAGQAMTSAYTAPVGQTITWNNQQTGNAGQITPVQEFYTPQGNYCREFTQTIYIGGEAKKANGSACLMPDGSWRVAS